MIWNRLLPIVAILAIALPASSAWAEPADAGIETRANAISTGIGSLTGVAISPVLVLGIFGFVHWWNAPAGVALPLHAQPWLWAPLLAVSALAAISRTGCMAIPGSKYLLDAPKQIHSKITGVVAAGIFLSTVTSILRSAGIADGPAPGVETAGFATLAIVPIVVISYLSVWIVSNTLDALVFLSPFAIVDAFLLSFRGIVLSLVLGATAIDHWLGFPLLTILVCGPILIVCLIIAGPCVRLNLFAFLCAWDFLTRRRRRTRAEEGRIRAFVASKHVGVPVRTMGHVEPADGVVRFEYRPLFVLPARRIDVPARGPRILRGVIWSAVTVEHAGTRRAVFSFPPRYLGHEPVLAERFGASVEDGLVRRGIRGTIDFVRGMFGLVDRSKPVVA